MSKGRTSPKSVIREVSILPPVVKRGRDKCLFFSAGICRKGSHCLFAHTSRNGCPEGQKGGDWNDDAKSSQNSRSRASITSEQTNSNRSKGRPNPRAPRKSQGRPNRRTKNNPGGQYDVPPKHPGPPINLSLVDEQTFSGQEEGGEEIPKVYIRALGRLWEGEALGV
ncbi:hypothetical protein FA13DRAFT_1741258 [Coprinellus micaceus]|uniref:C3H1-type domain-containing protein n=1 Tax=Coprinellus micaceus TaxID=71717 RepID=A0A4Y7SJM6_COPMI|nr:hypothetical protein FA13DRAFT_1741258 [Coprinellus micaceus]